VFVGRRASAGRRITVLDLAGVVLAMEVLGEGEGSGRVEGVE
jgi:hypothetical protein